MISLNTLRLALDHLGSIRLRLDRLESLPWDNFSLVDVTMVAFQLVFASKTIVSAVFTSKNRTWEFRGIGTVSNGVVALEISPFFGDGFASFLKAVVVSRFAEMGLLVWRPRKIRVPVSALLLTTWNSALQRRSRRIFAQENAAHTAALMIWIKVRLVTVVFIAFTTDQA